MGGQTLVWNFPHVFYGFPNSTATSPAAVDSGYLFIYLFIYLSTYLSIYLSVYLFIYLSTYIMVPSVRSNKVIIFVSIYIRY